MAEVTHRTKYGSTVDSGSDNEDHSHHFKLYSFKTVTFCAVCDKMLWGFSNQGYNCECCDMSVHKGCVENAKPMCKMANVTQEGCGSPESVHRFRNHNFKVPSFCSHCGSLLFGFFNQGLKCEDCNRQVHHRCGVKTSMDCDVTHE